MSKVSQQVFFDQSGKRLARMLLMLAVLALLISGGVVWLVLRQTEPLWQAQQNRAPEYPRQLTESAGDMPVIGSGVLVRVNLVSRRGDKLLLTDPFTGRVLRQANPEETKKIGSSSSVIERYGNLADHQIALTFDDGPSGKYTPELLDLLKRESVPATFFMIGEHALEYPEVVQRVVQEGHMIGGHTLTHIDFDDHGAFRNRQEILSTQRILRDVAGATHVSTVCHTPPRKRTRREF